MNPEQNGKTLTHVILNATCPLKQLAAGRQIEANCPPKSKGAGPLRPQPQTARHSCLLHPQLLKPPKVTTAQLKLLGSGAGRGHGVHPTGPHLGLSTRKKKPENALLCVRVSCLHRTAGSAHLFRSGSTYGGFATTTDAGFL